MGDLGTARWIAVDPANPSRNACFLAHLAAEKALKAVLIHHKQPPRRVHDLFELASVLPGKINPPSADDLDSVNAWAIEGRYPADFGDATPIEAGAAIAAAASILEWAQDLILRAEQA